MTAVDAPTDNTFVEALEAAEGQVRKVHVTGGDVREGKVAQAADKDGERRFKVGRHVVSVSTITQVVEDAPADPAPAPEPAPEPPAAAENGRPAPDPAKQADEPKPEPVRTTLTSGKAVVGKTLTIRCAWVDPDNRTAAQQKLFDTGFAGVEKGKSYEAMVKAAGRGAKAEAAMPDGAERVIKVQDAFQVRFSPENQKRHRNELRRRGAQARRAAREAAKAAKAAS